MKTRRLRPFHRFSAGLTKTGGRTTIYGRTTIQRSEGEPDADPTVWFCERSLEGESEQNLEGAKAHGGAAASVRRRRVGLPRATSRLCPLSSAPTTL